MDTSQQTKLTIYGTAASRTFRTIWMAKELGLDFSHEPVDFRAGDTQQDWYLAINPNGHIPSIRDGDFTLWESFAINLYLSRKYPGSVSPNGLEEEMTAIQWSIWALTELNAHCDTILLQSFRPTGQRDAALIAHAFESMRKPMGVFERHIAAFGWILGGRFTVADLNVASVIRTLPRIASELPQASDEVAAFNKLSQWLTACLQRPAAVAASDMQSEAYSAIRRPS